MVIHSASDPRPKTTLCGDYFYNYFTRGLDILFDGQVIHSVYFFFPPSFTKLFVLRVRTIVLAGITMTQGSTAECSS